MRQEEGNGGPDCKCQKEDQRGVHAAGRRLAAWGGGGGDDAAARLESTKDFLSLSLTQLN